MILMISQPMYGKSEETIKEERKSLVEKLEKEGHKVLDTVFADGIEEMNDNDIPLEDNTKPHRAPQRIILPEVYYDAGQACLHILTTEEENEVAYIIRNEEEGTSASGVTVKREGYHDIDLSCLPCGDYTLILEVAGCEYSAQITL